MPGENKAVKGGRRYGQVALIVFFLIATTSLVYGPNLDHEFIFDDYPYISGSPIVQKGLGFDSLKWALTDSVYSSWQPVTWFSLIMDYEFHGLDPAGYHLTNLILHILSSVVLFIVFWRLTGRFWLSTLVAALFALHPINVETVAWASQRKNVLSGLFWMLAMWAYIWYTKLPNIRRYLLVSVLFILGLMSKLTMLPFPMAMLLLDYWPLKRLRIGGGGKSAPELHTIFRVGRRDWLKLILEKVPWLVIGVITVVILVFFAPADTMSNVDCSISLRVSNAAVSYVIYLGMLFWPVDLAVWYPFPKSIPLWQVLGSLTFVGLFTGAVWRWRNKRPYLLVGWLWYLGMLFPALGLVQSDIWPAQADHHLYLPAIGIFLMVSFGLFYSTAWRPRHKAVAVCGAVLVLSALALTARHQVGYWENEITLYRYALKVTENNAVVHNNLGVILIRRNRYHEALDHFRKAVRLDPEHASAYHNMGIALNGLQMHQEAREVLGKALNLNPGDSKVHTSLGIALAGLGQTEKALANFEEALRLEPTNLAALLMLGEMLIKLGRHQEAVWYMQQAITMNPQEERAHTTLGIALAGLGRHKEALEEFKMVLHINPLSYTAHYNIGRTLQHFKKYAEARRHYAEALRLKPDFGPAQKSVEEINISISRKKETPLKSPLE